MPGNSRKDIVREGEIGTYHTWSMAVQGAYLCGYDPETGQDFDYRRDWIRSLLEYQASVFAVDIGSYNILSNHQHLIARTRPDIAATWSAELVAWKWKLAWPRWVDGAWVREPTDQEIEEILAQPHRIEQLRQNLASLSWLMARWKEPIARLANAESGTKGHFYAQRYGSRELLDDPSGLCAFVYVDLNQKKAGMAASLESSRCSAIQDRLVAWKLHEARESLEEFQDRFPDGYEVSMGDMQKLYADCFLSPIDNQGPLILLDPDGVYRPLEMSAEPIVITADPSNAPTESEERESTQEPGDLSAQDSAAATPDNEMTCAEAGSQDAPAKPPHRQTNPRKKPSWKRHLRLQRNRRRRASDNPILGIPLKQYLDIAQLTAERLDAAKSQPPPEQLEVSLRQCGVEPSCWLGVVEHFGDWFHRAVGREDQLTRVIDRAGQKWIQGISACRDVFT